MLSEILLVSVVLVCGYQGFLVLRRGIPGQRLYGLLLFANMFVAAWAMSELSENDPMSSAGDLLSFVALAMFVSLVMLPSLVRDLARRAVIRDRMGLARRLLGMVELLQPGFGAAQERDLVNSIAMVRAGRVDDILAELETRRSTMSEPMARRSIDERVILLLLYARRWQQATETFERTLERQPGPTTAQLHVELIRAYGELGQLDRAAELVTRLEGLPLAEQPALLFFVTRARMVFLAFCGRSEEVQALLGPAGPLSVMPPEARSYWLGVALLHAGDEAGARQALERAIKRAGRDSRSRDMAKETLDAIATGMVDGPRTIAPDVVPVVERVAEAAREPQENTPATSMPRLQGSVWQVAPVSAVLIAVNLAVFAAVTLLLGSTEHADVLARAGANVKPLVADGQWWRLLAATVLHAGFVHLALNMYGLWILGKLVEQLMGRWRYLTLYVLSGLGGSLASLWFGAGQVSVGASGAVLGLLGAATAELALRRGAYPDAWRRAALGSLVFIVIANLGIGALFPVIDQSAHIGGMVTGGLLGAVLSPRGRAGGTTLMRVVAGALLALVVAAVVYSIGGAVTHLGGQPFREQTVDGRAVQVPGDWIPLGEGAFGAVGKTHMMRALLVRSAMVPPGTTAQSVLEEIEADQPGGPVEATFPAVPGWSKLERLVTDSGDTDLEVHEATYLRVGADNTLWRVDFAAMPDDAPARAQAVPRVLGSLEPG